MRKLRILLIISGLLGCVGYLLYLLSVKDEYLHYLKKYIALQDIHD